MRRNANLSKTLHMGQQTGVIKGFGGILRNADSLPYAATPYTWGYPSKVFVCGVAIFSRRNGMGNHVADIHPRHVAVALRQRVELLVGSVIRRTGGERKRSTLSLSRSGVRRLKPVGSYNLHTLNITLVTRALKRGCILVPTKHTYG